MPIANAALTELLTRGEQGSPQGSLPGLGRPLRPTARPFQPAAFPFGQPAAVLHAESDVATRPPDQLYELGLTTIAMGYHTAAIEALRDCTEQAPNHAAAWRKLAELLRLANDEAAARAADAAADAVEEAGSATSPSVKTDAGERAMGHHAEAERRLHDLLQGASAEAATATLRAHLVDNPRDAAAMRLLAGLERLAEDRTTAQHLLERALEVRPGYFGAREDYARLLLERRYNSASAAIEIKRLLDHEPRNTLYRMMYVLALVPIGEIEAAVDVLTDLLREDPGETQYWLSYAECLHFLGRRDESEQAFRKCLELKPGMGEAYWGLADLKGRFISDADVAEMRARLEEQTLEPGSRMHMLYALAATLERAGDFAASFAAYEEGAGLFLGVAVKTGQGHVLSHANRVRRTKAVFSRDNLDTRLVPAPATATGATPIFIVGMPRAGSTLVEQILASHSMIEGTRELPLIGEVTRALVVSRLLVTPDAYPECVLDLTQDQLAGLGARVIERAGDHRKTDRPYFVDKRPWNWLDAGLIHLILPQAKIIDVRREPMAACFAMYKQLLPSDAAFSYDLGHLGAYYNDYVGLMDHWRRVLPERIHFLQYERLVEDTESEIRRLLDYCGLPFEEGCLRFWETERAVSTPSAEQVRRPIFRDALQHWRNFEPWLGPLQDALDQPSEA